MIERLTKDDAAGLARDAADRWMARKHSGAMNADERRAFEEWLASSAENRRAFAEVERALERVDAAGEALLEAEFEDQLRDAAASEERSGGRRATLIAASLAVFAVAGVVALHLSGRGGSPAPVAYETAIGESEKIALADGSEIELNTNSRITVAYDASARSVAIEQGEAFFDVEKDRERPFLVKTRLAEIAVTGTSFNVSAFGDGAMVNVLTGVVAVKPLNGLEVTLLAGDAVRIGADGSAGAVARFDPTLVFAWRTGKARFHEEPLRNVVATLNRHFETPIILEDERLGDLPVTGEFDIKDRATAVTALALIFGLESRDEPARTVLREARTP
ncbi:MAG: FecR domain-containing protein [Parvularculaceae bacterium]|nr:FecR domain-containing protein [Parvularculaceae bacterium]